MTCPGICIRCRNFRELPTGAMCAQCFVENEEEGYPPNSDSAYRDTSLLPEDPPRDDDSYGSEVTHG